MIKTFEEYGRNIKTYSIGEYLLVDIDGKQFKVKTMSFTTTYDTGVNVKFSNGEIKKINIKYDIVRYLTPEEIEEYKIESDSNKYNI